MTSHSGRDDEPREGVILPSGEGGPNADPAIGVPAPGQPWGQPWGPEATPAQPPGPPQSPPPAQPPAEPPVVRRGRHSLPPEPTPPRPQAPPQVSVDEDATAYIPAVEATAQIRRLPSRPTPERPSTPPVDSEGATQLIPPVRPGDDEAATRFIPPVPAVDDEAATRFIPPVPAVDDAAATRFIPPVPAVDDEAATRFIPPVPPVDDEAATRVMPPVPDAGRDPEATTRLRAVRPGPPRRSAPAPTPPPGFDNLFRSAATHTPQDDLPPPYYDEDREPRRRNPALVVMAVVVGCAIVGLGAGAALSGGGGGDGGGPAEVSQGVTPEETEGEAEDGQNETEPEAAPREAENDAEAAAQAQDLSSLLDDSNDSRDSVIAAVADIRQCKHLNRAATDLRAAAQQRNGLVTRLEGLPIDALPQGDALVQSLTEAWRASAEADEHYAAWADQASQDRQVCDGGQAQHTDRATQGDSASGRATQAKEQAAGLWNPVARDHGLPERAATEL
ncbi:hypothetical protein [Streptomyces sp. NBC_01803]|uniref:hypothetical protein n=1 Tax=Streptomyces sp. NBC_01803 TaxID=2975946 RepID=UPI002DD7D15D|nr:hypothetical protein [Streptomyces sp. NBC_01803]WSA44739.1 hypothetical protein OIE51_11310 [Streptomyces sp. NBC_01803]